MYMFLIFTKWIKLSAIIKSYFQVTTGFWVLRVPLRRMALQEICAPLVICAQLVHVTKLPVQKEATVILQVTPSVLLYAPHVLLSSRIYKNGLVLLGGVH